MRHPACLVCGGHNVKRRIYAYVECAHCGSLYLRRMPPADYLTHRLELYGKQKHKELIISEIEKSRLHDILKLKKPHSTLLDVGCGMGTFVQYARSQGFLVCATDKARGCIGYLRKIGIPAYSTILGIPNHTFDVITLFDVIEHVPNPTSFLSDIRRKLKKNGVLVVTTPNVKGISSRVIPSLLTRPTTRYSEHMTLFSPTSLMKLMKRSGFKPLSLSTDMFMPWSRSRNVFVRKAVNKIVYLLFLPIQQHLYSRNLGDNIQIIARIS